MSGLQSQLADATAAKEEALAQLQAAQAQLEEQQAASKTAPPAATIEPHFVDAVAARPKALGNLQPLRLS